MDHDFEDIEVKENALGLLEDALRRKRGRCMIGTGATRVGRLTLSTGTVMALAAIRMKHCGRPATNWTCRNRSGWTRMSGNGMNLA